MYGVLSIDDQPYYRQDVSSSKRLERFYTPCYNDWLSYESQSFLPPKYAQLSGVLKEIWPT